MNWNYSEIAPPKWKRRRIEDACVRVTSGGTPSRKRSDFYGGDVLWVKTKELLDDWIEDTEEKLTLEGLKGSSAKLIKENTVLMAMYGATVGQLGILRYEATCNQAACAMEVDPEEADFRYLFYTLLQHRDQIIGMATGAAQQNLNGVTIKNLIVPFPYLNEQKSIADIIATLDDKIALNRKLNETLEGMARALFQSWFVDFDPVKAKLAAVRHGRDPERACMAALSGKIRIPRGLGAPTSPSASMQRNRRGRRYSQMHLGKVGIPGGICRIVMTLIFSNQLRFVLRTACRRKN